jgi:hypothetical protein
MASDSSTLSIKVAVVVLIAVMIFAVAAGLIVPFNVEQTVTVQALSGEIDILIPNDPPTPLLPNTQAALAPGHSVRLQPSSEASLTFTINKGRALLTGPATLTLVESHRRATSLGHALDNLSRSYTLTLQQTQGTVSYNFANTTPPFEDIQLTIQLPDANYSPTTPCWTITVDTAGHSTAESVTCPN